MVAFGDADCWPEGLAGWTSSWRRSRPRRRPPGGGGPHQPIATTCFGAAATTPIDFMYFDKPARGWMHPQLLREQRGLPASRCLLATATCLNSGIDRGHCQVLGLRAAGVRACRCASSPRRAPSTVFPDSVRDFAPTAAAARSGLGTSLRPTWLAPYPPARLHWLARLGPLSGLAAPGGPLRVQPASRCASNAHTAGRGPRWLGGRRPSSAALQWQPTQPAPSSAASTSASPPPRAATPPSPTTRTWIDSAALSWSC